MQKFLERKSMVLALALLALLALVLLTNALNTIDFMPSQPIGGGPAEPTVKPSVDLEKMLNRMAEEPLWKHLVFWAVLFIVVVIFTSLLNPEARKQLLYAFLRIALSAFILLYILKQQREFLAEFLSRFSGISQNLEIVTQDNALPAPVFTPPQEVSWISFAVTFSVILLGVFLVWRALRAWARFCTRYASKGSLNEIAAIARESLSELRTGHNYENTIVECYDRMSEVVARRQGLKRENSMTPSEFSIRLTRAGLPRDSIESLTALFEAVRYGRRPAGQTEIDQAVRSLTSILAYCGEGAS